MAKIKIKHYVIRTGKHGYWLPTPKMVAMGFQPVACGHDGPDAWKIARGWEERYQAARKGLEPEKGYPAGSIGDAFSSYRRMEAWKSRPIRMREEWERGWAYIEPIFGDLPPSAITLEHLDDWYAKLLKKHGIDGAYRAMKTWRALYVVMAGMKLVTPKADPSLAIRRKTPKGRTATWSAGEVVRLVKSGWRASFRGLACQLLAGRRANADARAGGCHTRRRLGIADRSHQDRRSSLRHAVKADTA